MFLNYIYNQRFRKNNRYVLTRVNKLCGVDFKYGKVKMEEMEDRNEDREKLKRKEEWKCYNILKKDMEEKSGYRPTRRTEEENEWSDVDSGRALQRNQAIVARQKENENKKVKKYLTDTDTESEWTSADEKDTQWDTIDEGWASATEEYRRSVKPKKRDHNPKYNSDNSVTMRKKRLRPSINVIEEVLSAELNTTKGRREDTDTDTTSEEDTGIDGDDEEDWEQNIEDILENQKDSLAEIYKAKAKLVTEEQREAHRKMKAKFHVPKRDPELPADFYHDKRDIIEIVRDLCVKLTRGRVPEELKHFYDTICKYDTSQRLVTPGGLPLLREEILERMKNWKNKEKASEQDKKIMSEIEQEAEKMKEDEPEYGRDTGQFSLTDKEEVLASDEEIDVQTAEKRKKGETTIDINTVKFAQLPYIKVEIRHKDGRHQQEALLDSGAQCSILNYRDAVGPGLRATSEDIIDDQKITLSTPSKSHGGACKGVLQCKIILTSPDGKKMETMIDFILVSSEFRLGGKCILGSDFLQKINGSLHFAEDSSSTLECTTDKEEIIYLPCVTAAVRPRRHKDNEKKLVSTVAREESDSEVCSWDNEVTTDSEKGEWTSVPELVESDTDSEWWESEEESQSGEDEMEKETGLCRWKSCTGCVWCQDEEALSPCPHIFHSPRCRHWTRHDEQEKCSYEHGEDEDCPCPRWKFKPYPRQEEGKEEQNDKDSTSQAVPIVHPHRCHGRSYSAEPKNYPQSFPKQGHIPGPSLNSLHVEENNSSMETILTEKEGEAQINKSELFPSLPQKTSSDKMIPTKGTFVTEDDFEKRNLMGSLEQTSKKDDKVSYAHLHDDKLIKSLKEIEKEFPDVWKTQKEPLGRFKYWEASFSVNNKEGESLIQKNRNTDWSKSKKARDKLQQLQDVGVLGAPSENPVGLSNFLLIAKPVEGHHMKTGIQETKKMTEEQKSQIPYRIVSDFTTVNQHIDSLVVTTLPTVETVKEKVSDALVSCFDIADMYFHIEISRECRKYLGTYGPKGILEYKRLAQGLRQSAAIAMQAMSATFSPEILQEFKTKYKIEWKSLPDIDTYDKIVLWYIDDCLVFSSNKQQPGQDSPEKIHNTAIRAVLYALQRAGWKLAKNKTNFRTKDFVFLGQRYEPEKSLVGLSLERMEALVNSRIPRSTGEAASTWAKFSYCSAHLPMMRMISLPVSVMIHSGKFSWSENIAKAFSEMKVLALLSLSTYNFDPTKHQYVFLDASKVAIAYSHFQLTEDGRLQLIKMKSKILTAGQMHSASVFRETEALAFGFYECEKEIQNSQKTFNLITDCQSLLALRRTKNYRSKYYELAVHLSGYKQLQILYLPGRCNIMADQLSRNLNEVLIPTEKTEAGYKRISEQASRIFPPPPKIEIDKIMKLKGDDIARYLLSTQKSDWIDVFCDKRYTQSGLHTQDFLKLIQSQQAEQDLFNFLSRGWQSPEAYNIDIIADLVRQVKILSKSNFETVCRKLQLNDLRKHLLEIGCQDTGMTRLKSNYGQEERKKLQRYLFNNKRQHGQEDPKNYRRDDTQVDPKDYKRDDTQEDPEHDKRKSGQESPSQSQTWRVETRAQRKRGQEDQKKEEAKEKEEAEQKCDCGRNHDSEEMEEGRLYKKHEEEIEEFNNKMTSLNEVLTEEKLQINENSPSCPVMKMKSFKDTARQLMSTVSQKEWKFFSTMGTREQLKLSFVPIYFETGPDIKVDTKRKAIEIKTTSNIILEEWTAREIEFKLYIGTDEEVELTQEVDTKKYFVHHNEGDGLGYYTSKLVIHNLTPKQQRIEAGTILSRLNYKEEDSTQIIYLRINDKMFHVFRDSILAAKQESGRYQVDKIFRKYFNSAATEPIIQACVAKVNQQEEVEENYTRLDALVIAQRLQKSGGQLYRDDYENLQRNDKYIENLYKRVQNGREKRFVIENGILYKKNDMDGVELRRLVVPRAFYELLAKSFHQTNQPHYQSDTLLNILNTILYTREASIVIKRIVEECATCLLSKPARKRREYGSQRSIDRRSLRTAEYWMADIAYMPPGTFWNGNKVYKFMLVVVESLSGFSTAWPLPDIKTNTVCRTLQQNFLNIFSPQYLHVDYGAEFTSKRFEQLMTSHNVKILGHAPGRKESSGQVESIINSLKKALRVALVDDSAGNEQRRHWPEYLNQSLRGYNDSVLLNSQLSKRQILFSPLVYTKSSLPRLMLKNQEDVGQLHRKNILKLLDIRDAVLGRLRTKHRKSKFLPGQFVIQRKSNKTVETTDGSKEITPQSELYRIIEVMKDGQLIALRSLVTGNRKQVNPTEIEHVQNEYLSLANINNKSLFDRLGASHIANRYRRLNKGLQSVSSAQDIKEDDQDGQEDKEDLEETQEPVLVTMMSSLKSILKEKNKFEILDMRKYLYTLKQDQREALSRAASDSIIAWTEDQERLMENLDKIKLSSTEFYYTEVPVDLSQKASHRKKVQFNMSEEETKQVQDRKRLNNSQVTTKSITGLFAQIKFAVSGKCLENLL